MGYKSGYNATVTLDGVLLDDAKLVNLPTDQGQSIDVQYLGGVQVVQEGRTSYGRLTLTTSQLGEDTVVSEEVITCEGDVPALGKHFSVTGNIVSVNPGSIQRGQAIEKTVELHCNSAVVWTAIS
jgi:hypothetical protein